MAQVFKKTIGTTGYGYSVYLVGELTETSYSIENNTSTVARKVYAYIGGGTASDYNTVVKVNDSEIFNGYANITTSGVVFLNDTITVTHNDKGEGSCSLSASMSMAYLGYSGSGSGSIALTTIPRAGEITSVTGTYLGSAVTVNIDRKSTAFTHKIEYDFAGSGYRTAITNCDGSDSFTPALGMAVYIPNSTYGILTVRLTTWSGTTQIGSASSKTITLYLPDSVVPSFTSLTLARVNNEVPSDWEVYLKGYSQVTATINGASGIYGSTIRNYSIIGAGYSTTSSSFTTGILNDHGTFTFTAKVTDSRGRSATKTLSITVLDYFAPTISIEAKRCLEDETIATNGTYLLVTCTFNYDSVSGKNSANVKVECNGASETDITSGASFRLDANCLVTKNYTVYATISDEINTSKPKTVLIPTATILMAFFKNNKGGAVGRYPTIEDAFQVGWDLYDKTGRLIEIGAMGFYIAHDSSSLTLGNYDDWVAAGMPMWPTD